MQTQQLSTLMRLSWKIQHIKKISRSKSLVSAWVIYHQADIMIYYLVKKHTPEKWVAEIKDNDLTLIF